jgi:hypothetical protein
MNLEPNDDETDTVMPEILALLVLALLTYVYWRL